MRIELVTEPGDHAVPNEDYAAVGSTASGLGGTLVVLDGVTPPAVDHGCSHGVSWYVSRLGGTLLELSGSHPELTLTQCLATAISRTADAHSPICDLSHPRTPQATVVLARWSADHDGREGSVEHLVLSDSVLLLEDPSGAVRPVLDPRLDELLPTVRGLPQAERVRRIEALRNRPGGFHTAAAEPSVAELAVTGSTPRGRVRSLAALTDGATRWSEVFGLGDWSALHAALRKEGPRAVVARVRAEERAAAAGGGRAYGKTHDDATAVLVELPGAG
ncbi:protein phosphatase 2C domain-containing protein [Streptomyces durbertensis]|uniref:Protein phosphatase 2C domain-containing protein n=1 Tax=Streptomyces durbertensis TaxID=2448886 RepID=A0ABR6EF40_9ACTN|nr:protein phosphatase 2C domain-containing protein [Streptomyces durbertensis]MBB1243089.1 protein phosphatase 2C domain-containing protein [Streptomyces durbertensis]